MPLQCGGGPLTGRITGAWRAAAVAVTLAIAGPGRARAGEAPRDRPPVRLALDACLDAGRDAFQRAVGVEVEVEVEAAVADPAAIVVRVACAAGGVDAGVVLEIERPDTSRRYRYALDWRAQPIDARPRLLGLAVAEAVDASRIELTAVPEAPAPDRGALPEPPRAEAAPDWTLGLAAGERTFSANAGVQLSGAALVPGRRLTQHLWIAADVAVEGTTVVARSGVVSVGSVSSAPRLVLRVGRRLHGDLGAGVRAGGVRMRGRAVSSLLAGQTQVRAWFGPVVSAAIGVELSPRVTAGAGLEIGAVAAGATARDLLQPVAVIGGRWTALTIGVAMAL